MHLLPHSNSGHGGVYLCINVWCHVNLNAVFPQLLIALNQITVWRVRLFGEREKNTQASQDVLC